MTLKDMRASVSPYPCHIYNLNQRFSGVVDDQLSGSCVNRISINSFTALAVSEYLTWIWLAYYREVMNDIWQNWFFLPANLSL